MKGLFAAALAGAITLVATPANAADFIKYTFAGQGTVSTVGRGAGPSRSGEFWLTYVVPLPPTNLGSYTTDATSTKYSANIGTGLFQANTSMAATTSTFGFSEIGGVIRENYTASVNLCGSFAGVFPTTGGAVSPSCSSAKVIENKDLGFVPTTTQYDLSILSFSAERFSSVFSPYAYRGITGITAVPEPATWGMMLLGFAMIGATARARRPRVSFAN